MIIGSQAKKMFKEMSKSLTEKVMQDVGSKLIEAQKETQKQAANKMEEAIKNFKESTRQTAIKIINEEFEAKIRTIVKEEIKQ